MTIQQAFKNKKIGLALSGGGYRAAVFHLGVLSYMAKNGLLENVSHISTVSGGSIVMGLVYRLNDFKFPTSEEYLTRVHSQAIAFLKEHSLLKSNMTWWAFKGSLTNGWLVAHDEMLETLENDTWGLHKDIQELDDTPIWTINATTGETGKSWRFSKEKMGDYLVGYIKHPHITLAKAISASAGFPFAIGPLHLALNDYGYKPKNEMKKVTLYDGGMYDNLGTEVFFKSNATRLTKSIDFLIVSDASKPFSKQKDMFSLGHFGKLNQISDIITEQIRSLRLRMFYNIIRRRNALNLGIHIHIGDTTLGNEEEAKCAQGIKTDLKSFPDKENDCLINNGYHVAAKNFLEYLAEVQELDEMKQTDDDL